MFVIAAFGAVASADEAPEAASDGLRLDDSRWQPLPLGIGQVFVSPNGHLWLQDGRGRSRPELTQLQEHLAEQFGKKTPQIRDAEIMLFEPGGRIWFFAPHLQTILGYDGTTWITHEIDHREAALVGRCLTRGGLIDADVHRAAGGAVWLRGRRGVYRYDGKDWVYQDMVGEAAGRSGAGILLSVHPEGKLAVAHAPASRHVWLFREGRWTRRALFPEGAAPVVIHLAVESPESFLYVGGRRDVQRVLVQEDSALTHEESQEGGAILGHVQGSSVQALFADEQGRLYLAADVIKIAGDAADRGDAAAGGVVIHDPEGETRVVRGDGPTAAWRPRFQFFPPPLLTASRTQVWLPNRATGRPAHLFDLENGERVEQLPDPTFGHLHAVTEEGKLFVSRGRPAAPTHPIMVFDPEGREQPTLQVITKEIGRGPIAVGDEGTIWALDASGRLICFDDGQWSTASLPASGRVDALLPGLKGMVLVHQSGGAAALCRRSQVIAAGDLFQLLEDHRERIVEAFGPRHPLPPERSPLQVTASRQGRIWCLHHRALRLFADDRWYDATDALTAAGSRSGGAELLAPICDGDKVFVSDLSLRHDGGRSFFGEMNKGKLKFTEAPHAMSITGVHALATPGRQGALWIASSEGRAGRSSDLITGQRTVRVQEQGVVEKLVNAGYPRLVDFSGNVWLAAIRGEAADRVNLWRDGKIVQKLRIPAYAGGLLGSDRPGSVYAHTVAGLRRLTADPPDSGEYRLGELYVIEGLTGQTTFEAFSRQGYFVFAGYVDHPSRAYRLHLVKLPAD